MSINDLYELFFFIIDKNGGQGDISPDEFNLLVQQAENSFMDYLLGEFQQFQVMHPIPRVQYSNTEITRQRLIPFIYRYDLTIDSSGFAHYPDDYLQTDAMWKYRSYYERIRYAAANALSSYYNSKIDPYSKYPIYTTGAIGFSSYYNAPITGLQFYPASLGMATLSYVRSLPSMYWGYFIDENGLPQYWEEISRQPLWYDQDLLEILTRALRMTGVKLELNQVGQYATEIKNAGQ